MKRIEGAHLNGALDQFIDFESRELQKNKNGCVFLHSSRCSVYEYRPDVCRLFPYNFKTVETETGSSAVLTPHELAVFVCFKEQGNTQGMEQVQEAIKTVKDILQRGLIDHYSCNDPSTAG